MLAVPDGVGEIFRGWFPAVLAAPSRRERHFRRGYAS